MESGVVDVTHPVGPTKVRINLTGRTLEQVAMADRVRFATRRALVSARHPPMTARMASIFWDRRRLARRHRPAAPRPRTLTYHSVEQPDWGVNDISVARLRRHISLARSLGYRFVPASEIPDALPTERVLSVTFDDGARSVVTHAAQLLADEGISWTMFVATDWADGQHGRDLYLTWDDVGALAASGVTIGSHSRSHPDFGQLEPAAIEDDLSGAAERFRQELGSVPADFAIPFGTSRNWTAYADATARALGHSRIWSQSEDLRAPDTLSRSFVVASDIDPVFAALLDGAFDGWEEPPV